MEQDLAMLFPQYQKNIDEFRKVFNRIEETKAADNFVKNKDKKKLIEDIEKGINFSAFLSITMLDLIVILKNIKESNHQAEINYFIKNGYLLIHEVLITYNSHSKNINSLISEKLSDLKNPQKGLSEVIKEFKSINKYDSFINTVRNNVAGHISNDFINYYDILSQFDNKSAQKTFEHFMIVLGAMQILSKKISSRLMEAM